MTKPRILALHGAASNNEITKIQLENLKITDEDYDIVYLHGIIGEDQGHPDAADYVNGPWYSWIDTSDMRNKYKILSSIGRAVHAVYNALQRYGPFDGIYGFSSGAAIASIVVAMAQDPLLKSKFLQRFQKSPFDIDESSSSYTMFESEFFDETEVSESSELSDVQPEDNTLLVESEGLFGWFKMMQAAVGLHTDATSIHPHWNDANVLEEGLRGNDDTCIVKFVIFACAAAPYKCMEDFKRVLLGRSSTTRRELFQPSSIGGEIKSFHVIAKRDDHKSLSEEFAMLFRDPKILYTSGEHRVPRDLRNDSVLIEGIKSITKGVQQESLAASLPLQFSPVSGLTSIARLSDRQVTLVRHDQNGNRTVPTTFLELLEQNPCDKPFLYNARDEAFAVCQTHGCHPWRPLERWLEFQGSKWE